MTLTFRLSFKGKSKGKSGKQGKRGENASLSKNKDLSNIECYNGYKKGHYANTYAESDTREKSKNKQFKKLKKD
jgi:hypothetical protein